MAIASSYNLHIFLGFLVFTLIFNGNNSDEYKQWQPNTNWNNPNNWQTKKVPCARQNVQLLSLQPLIVAVSGQMSLRSMSLPSSGELVLNKDAELTFHNDDTPSAQCPGGDNKFTATDPEDWYNPDNWREVDGDGNPVVQQSNGLLHLNQVPCTHDKVQFIQGSSFLVKSDQEITISSVIMNGQVYTQKSFQDFLGSSSGKIQFKMNKESIMLTGDTCSDPKGCFCNTLQVKETVCSFVKCEKPQCKTPLVPSGSCCSYCGTILKIKPLTDFNLVEIKDQVYRMLKKRTRRASETPQIQISVSRLQDGLVQIVFADSGDGLKAQSFADNVVLDISESSKLTIEDKIQSSKPSPKSGPQEGSSSLVGVAVGIGIGIAVLIVIVIVVVVLYKSKRRTQPDQEEALPTAKYEHVEMQPKSASPSTEQLNEPCQTHEADNDLYVSADNNGKAAFDNPLYESTNNRMI